MSLGWVPGQKGSGVLAAVGPETDQQAAGRPQGMEERQGVERRMEKCGEKQLSFSC